MASVWDFGEDIKAKYGKMICANIIRLLDHVKLKHFSQLLLQIKNVFQLKDFLEFQLTLPPVISQDYTLTDLKRLNMLNFKLMQNKYSSGLNNGQLEVEIYLLLMIYPELKGITDFLKF